ncbi:hypothetical protein RUMGNA_03722 [Mediterraneibacter gnavus ATCC 29149]|uniref:Uncharacterized protein n=1 Tax=Mediterraneibacter gnavus (strain ATCC 29149 / DSM 114966 / JCM 6515 / VPI C7-9) TaxID=411470 RepID=A7B806_MEDG7|nr:hypothetical protein RUMGNA_03722 [Mediterraneibacter gnavus ATCC 29149]
MLSLPSRECGLKYHLQSNHRRSRRQVTPFAGVWIEMMCG